MINIAIRATYYIFRCSNRNWDSPDLMQFWIFFFFGFCFVFVFVFVFVFFVFCFFVFCFFFFLIIQSQAAFVNCLYVARFTIVHQKTQIKFPLLLLRIRNLFKAMIGLKCVKYLANETPPSIVFSSHWTSEMFRFALRFLVVSLHFLLPAFWL